MKLWQVPPGRDVLDSASDEFLDGTFDCAEGIIAAAEDRAWSLDPPIGLHEDSEFAFWVARTPVFTRLAGAQRAEFKKDHAKVAPPSMGDRQAAY